MALVQCSEHGLVEGRIACLHLARDSERNVAVPYFVVFDRFNVAIFVCVECVRLDWGGDSNLLESAVLGCSEHFSAWAAGVGLRVDRYLVVERIRQGRLLAGDTVSGLLAAFVAKDPPAQT